MKMLHWKSFLVTDTTVKTAKFCHRPKAMYSVEYSAPNQPTLCRFYIVIYKRFKSNVVRDLRQAQDVANQLDLEK